MASDIPDVVTDEPAPEATALGPGRTQGGDVDGLLADPRETDVLGRAQLGGSDVDREHVWGHGGERR